MANIVKSRKASGRSGASSGGKGPKRQPPAPKPKVQPKKAKKGDDSDSDFCLNKRDRDAVEKRKKRHTESTHGMITRAKANINKFRLMDLPAELRCDILDHAVKGKGNVGLDSFFVPPIMQTTRQLREEATPIFFATNKFTTIVRSNWCIRCYHFHEAVHFGYASTGKLSVSEVLPYPDRNSLTAPTFRDNVVRFHHVEMKIACVRYGSTKQIGQITLRVDRRRPKADFKITNTRRATVRALTLIELEVEQLVAMIEKRRIFNGYTSADIAAVASCCRWERATK